MRVIVVGATGNVGTSVLQSLESESRVTSVVGIARRRPRWSPGSKTSWHTADVAEDDLTGVFEGADAVVHLAWLFQPTRDPVTTWRANVLGSMAVFRSVAQARVPALIHASSVGAYSPGPKDRPVDESWPTHGWPRAAYGREKAYVERVLDLFERDHPTIRVVRMRPAFIFKRESASEQRRLFGGPFVPGRLVRRMPLIPDIPGLRVQALHTSDAAQAYRLAVISDVSGAFNLAAEPVLGPAELADLFGARLVPLSPWLARTAVAAGWHARLIPSSPGLLEMALNLPVMDTTRARTVLGWQPQYGALQAMREMIEGMSEGEGMDTPPLAPGHLKEEFTTRVGAKP
ncbi:NAD-dependent epimerase/dehydratase family protein [Nonomuraea africana]|uniref:Nucleoside-diphosphate-sugar epimerase n=1 Tax=Nonomuraea africana TaxID=46171 RepID=A0ABR9KC73_9ACTN|nr:NAD-dependent epimerase/dehydratase family protein [Nonomuraea africana]MBE1559607.1 nucleoside-diphosphate-sugar epimerase [Nonomuraea africana]